MRVIVTGGAGFIGSALVRHLVRDVGAEVLTVDKLTYAGNLASLRPIENATNHRFARIDVCDQREMASAFAEFRPDRVMHLAAESHVDRSITGARDFVETNIVGTFTLLEVARHYWSTLPAGQHEAFRFLQVSTDEVYGSLDAQGAFTELTPYAPSSPYSASKASADHLAMAWHRTYDLPVIVTNCSNNYGPFHFPEKLIPLTILNGLEEKPLPVYGDGGNVRDWLYVDDHAEALHAIASRGVPGRNYNVGARNELTNIEVVKRICAILDELNPGARSHQRLVTFVPDRPGHDRRYALDPSRVEAEIGWRPRHDFDQGLRQTVRWYLENEWWWRPLRDKVYGGERLGMLEAEPGQ
jgi:dTDP-glucose 4,6-dehydratase